MSRQGTWFAAFGLVALLAISGCSVGGERDEGEASQEVSEDGAVAEDVAQDGVTTQASGTPDDVQPQDDPSPVRAEVQPGQEEREEAYLAQADAPADVFEGAIVEAGYEACLRIEATADADEDALIDALSTGEIPNAENAIQNLCPEFQKYLTAASKGD